MIKHKPKIILHCDCNNYYASIESLLKPELRDVPMAVAGNPENRHGIILSKNDLAKAAGVKTAETIIEAKKKCPNLVCVQPHHKLYTEYSHKINQIYNYYTERVEPFSIDESSMDVTDTWYKFARSPKDLADLIRYHIKTKIGITISIGVSYNRIFAKLGSDLKKPDATTVIRQEDMKKIVWPLDITNLLYVGKVTAVKLRNLNINTIGELAKTDPVFLESYLGKQGQVLSKYARGLDQSEIQKYNELEEAKSIGNGSTFHQNLTTWQEIYQKLEGLVAKVSLRLKKANKVASVIQVQMKSFDFQVNSRQTTLDSPIQEILHIEPVVHQLIDELWDEETPIRLLAVTATGLLDKAEIYTQVSLDDWDPMESRMLSEKSFQKLDKDKNLRNLVAELNQSMGGNFIKLGLDMEKG